MNRKTRFAVLSVFLGASLIAFTSGAVNRVSVTETPGWQSYLSDIADIQMAIMQAESEAAASSAPMSQAAPAQPVAVPYFPAQYVLKAGADTSEPLSTF
jgi:hypothetical protein